MNGGGGRKEEGNWRWREVEWWCGGLKMEGG